MIQTKAFPLIVTWTILTIVSLSSNAHAAPPDTQIPALETSHLQALLGATLSVTLKDGQTTEGALMSVRGQALQLLKKDKAQVTVQISQIVRVVLQTPSAASASQLRTMQGKRIALTLQDESKLKAELVGFTEQAILLVDDDGAVRSVERAQVAELRRELAERHVGVALSLVPGIMVDVNWKLLRAYVNASFVLPAALNGELWGISAGIGVSLPVLPSVPEFRLDVLAHSNLMAVESACEACGYPTAYVIGFGLALGVHATLDNGFTAGMTIPIIGYSETPNYKGSTNAKVGQYFLSSAVGMPLAFLGYRF